MIKKPTTTVQYGKAPGAPGNGFQLTGWQQLAMVCCFILIFGLGFKMGGAQDGGSPSGLSAADSIITLHRQEVSLKASLKKCESKRRGFLLDKEQEMVSGQPKEDVVQARRLSEKLATEVNELDVKSSKLEQDVISCETEKENEARNFDKEDEEHKDMITALNEKIRSVAMDIKALGEAITTTTTTMEPPTTLPTSGNDTKKVPVFRIPRGMNRPMGMRSNLLTVLLQKLRRQNLQLRQKLGMPIYGILGGVESNGAAAAGEGEGNTSTGALPPPAAAYARLDQEVLNANHHRLNNTHMTMMLSSRVEIEEGRRDWKKFSYQPNIHSDIFIPTSDGLSRTPTRPMYFGRLGSSVVVRGTYLASSTAASGAAAGGASSPSGAIAKRRPMRIPTSTTASAIRQLYSIALCAYKNHNPNFTFPHQFYRSPMTPGMKVSDALSSYTDIIDTPLLTFCTDCQDMRFTLLFLEACRGDTVENLYGGEAFWSMRSMIRFQPELVVAAQEQLERLGVTGTGKRNKATGTRAIRSLAIAFKQPPSLKSYCFAVQRRLPLRSYVWLTGNYPEAFAKTTPPFPAAKPEGENGAGVSAPAEYDEPMNVEVNPELVDHQCFPGLDDLQRGVAMIAKNTLWDEANPEETPQFDVIFISISSGVDRSKFENLDLGATYYESLYGTSSSAKTVEIEDGPSNVTRRRTAAPAPKSSVSRPGPRVIILQPESAEEDALELLVSASASQILVNRFSEHSQVLTEMFLLRHQLKPQHIHFF